MANIKSSKKRVITSEKRRKKNVSHRSMLRNSIKKVCMAIDSGDRNIAQKKFDQTQPIIDRQASKKLISKNKAARHKSNLIKKIKKII
ncbi:30S ribosomal protein S20 [Candidatus Tachikawaea gelatinosa]|uniref:Small ribosomal subunit protein bS20 n=1 Tax=Candidatus Tachikawaea gelatinosa TaxID=1410383 RepID=A0A090ASF9_9ENTR|nr:30S ribosomal protein S20 [Candidatus Tachikawaea gelatinosa]BAP58795.1 30S ribosomal protein S20 [Candidatus Tachikawaea gelatinosa]